MSRHSVAEELISEPGVVSYDTQAIVLALLAVADAIYNSRET